MPCWWDGSAGIGSVTPVEEKQLRQRIVAVFPWAESKVTSRWLDEILPCDLKQLRETMNTIEWASRLTFEKEADE